MANDTQEDSAAGYKQLIYELIRVIVRHQDEHYRSTSGRCECRGCKDFRALLVDRESILLRAALRERIIMSMLFAMLRKAEIAARLDGTAPESEDGKGSKSLTAAERRKLRAQYRETEREVDDALDALAQLLDVDLLNTEGMYSDVGNHR